MDSLAIISSKWILKDSTLNGSKECLWQLFLLQVYVRNPKQDLHGLGFDPYKHAPEFRGM